MHENPGKVYKTFRIFWEKLEFFPTLRTMHKLKKKRKNILEKNISMFTYLENFRKYKKKVSKNS